MGGIAATILVVCVAVATDAIWGWSKRYPPSVSEQRKKWGAEGWEFVDVYGAHTSRGVTTDEIVNIRVQGDGDDPFVVIANPTPSEDAITKVFSDQDYQFMELTMVPKNGYQYLIVFKRLRPVD